MEYSRRKRPELPPSSVTVTTAAIFAIGRCSPFWLGVAMCAFNPRSNIESPVPPPSATMRMPLERECADLLTDGGTNRLCLRAPGKAVQ